MACGGSNILGHFNFSESVLSDPSLESLFTEYLYNIHFYLLTPGMCPLNPEGFNIK